jgi:hypothetical protein
LFFQGAEKWTSDPSLAFDFRFTDRAVRFIETWHLRGVEVAFDFEPSDPAAELSAQPTAPHFSA